MRFYFPVLQAAAKQPWPGQSGLASTVKTAQPTVHASDVMSVEVLSTVDI